MRFRELAHTYPHGHESLPWFGVRRFGLASSVIPVAKRITGFYRSPHPAWRLRRRRLLVATLIELNAIAALARIGLSSNSKVA